MAKESAYFKVANLNGRHGVKQLKRELDAIKGVISVSVSPDNQRVAVDFDDTGVSRGRIEESLGKMGFQVTAETSEKHIM